MKEGCYTFATSLLMFQVALGTHPSTILDLFNKSANFDRNLEFILTRNDKYHLKSIPNSLIQIWNNLAMAFRGWLKENFEEKNRNKSVFTEPSTIVGNLSNKLIDYRTKGFKSALMDTFIGNYSSMVTCNNMYCTDCND